VNICLEASLRVAILFIPKVVNGRRKLIEIPANLAAILKQFAEEFGAVEPKKKLQHAKETAAAGAKIDWKQNCLRHSFCSYAVALKGLGLAEKVNIWLINNTGALHRFSQIG
jgi:hypothetical protein